MRAQELVGRTGKQPDGSAKTREVKLGAIFTQHVTDAEGHPVRDHQSTSYVASYAPAASFSLLLRAEARRRGVGSAGQVIFLSDGAAWTENIGQQCFAGGVSILDFYHACERLHGLSAALGGPKIKERASQWRRLLLKDRVAAVIQQGRQLQDQGAEEHTSVEEHLSFLERHQHRMRYGTYRKRGWFIGSGVIEAGCKTLAGKRLKQSGMFWSESGATCVLHFRTLLLSGRFDAFWTDRINSHAANNDAPAFSA